MKFEFPSLTPPSFLKDASAESWMDWKWQLRHSLKNLQGFDEFFKQRDLPLTENEKLGFQEGEQIFQFRTTPYYASLVEALNDPIRKILMPHAKEVEKTNPGEQHLHDPLNEKNNNPAPRIIHRYSDRLLFLVTDFCSVYCRYCTRKHFTGQDEAFPKKNEYEQALDYIRSKPGIREVILSGGDPLTLNDEQLDRVLFDLRQIEHVEIIRLGTRMPVVCPMRITSNLVKIIQSHKPVFLMTHFNHPRELTQQAAMAIESFVDHGIPVMNQMVLLNGVNNHPVIVQALARRLLYLRAKPYYMFQCDPSEGTNHLRTSIDQSMEIQRELWGHLSGLAMPILSLDIPMGGGKATLVPNFQTQQSPDRRTFRGWDGISAEYINPSADLLEYPSDWEIYSEEWQSLKKSKSIF